MARTVPGIYLLLIRLTKSARITYGHRAQTFNAGYYVYVGSAMAGLHGRLRRHLTLVDGGHWHIDGLLQKGTVVDVQAQVTRDTRAECNTAQQVQAWPNAQRIPGFGSSDCRCTSHLTYFRRRPQQSVRATEVQPAIPAMFSVLGTDYEDHASYDRDPFQTLVKCILSLRTQDPVTDAAAERLFRILQTPDDFRVSSKELIAETIYPVGMYRQKAQRLIDIAQRIVEQFDSQTPADIETLTTLPGVGRKTANLVRSFAFHKPAVCVDTHVHRITNRWGLVRTATPDDTEQELRRILPQDVWSPINPYLVQHGQQICRPLRPNCASCTLRRWCQYDRLVQEAHILRPIPNSPGHPTLKRLTAQAKTGKA